jgi:hypothetical protein
MKFFNFLSKITSNESVVDDLIQTVQSDPSRRYEALVSLKKIGNPKAIETFYGRLHDPSPRIRKISISALGEMGDSAAIYHLSQVINTQDFSYDGRRTNYGHKENITLAIDAILKIQEREKLAPELETLLITPSSPQSEEDSTDELMNRPPIDSYESLERLQNPELTAFPTVNHIDEADTPIPKTVDQCTIVIDEKIRYHLVAILKAEGTEIIENPRKLNGLLIDYCYGKNKKERNAILTVLEEKIPQDILKNNVQNEPQNLSVTQLVRQVSENSGLSNDLISWSIDSWIIALKKK